MDIPPDPPARSDVDLSPLGILRLYWECQVAATLIELQRRRSDRLSLRYAIGTGKTIVLDSSESSLPEIQDEDLALVKSRSDSSSVKRQEECLSPATTRVMITSPASRHLIAPPTASGFNTPASCCCAGRGAGCEHRGSVSAVVTAPGPASITQSTAPAKTDPTSYGWARPPMVRIESTPRAPQAFELEGVFAPPDRKAVASSPAVGTIRCWTAYAERNWNHRRGHFPHQDMSSVTDDQGNTTDDVGEAASIDFGRSTDQNRPTAQVSAISDDPLNGGGDEQASRAPDNLKLESPTAVGVLHALGRVYSWYCCQWADPSQFWRAMLPPRV